MNEEEIEVEIKWPEEYVSQTLNELRFLSAKVAKEILNAARYGENSTSIYFHKINPVQIVGILEALKLKKCKVEIIRHSQKAVTFIIDFKNMTLFEGEG